MRDGGRRCTAASDMYSFGKLLEAVVPVMMLLIIIVTVRMVLLIVFQAVQ